MRTNVTRQMEQLVSRSSLGARDVVKVRQTTSSTTAKKIVEASRRKSDRSGSGT